MGGLTGMHFVAGVAQAGGGEAFQGVAAESGQNLLPGYAEASADQIERACQAAAAAAPIYAAASAQLRATLLRTIADRLLALGDELVQRVHLETALPAARIEGERARTVLQLRQYADLVAEGSWVDAHVEHGDASRTPMPKPDLRRMAVALGPVVVFGASNFPLAYSVVGGDTVSALAAGCPVIVKGHPAHPGTSEMVGRIVRDAVHELGLPAGTFSMLHGRSHATGGALVRHDAVQAVGFTGSHAGGRALMDLAAARKEPIPVFAEMGSANPLVVLPKALATRGKQIAQQVAASALLAQGQFCTSPGLVLWLQGEGGDDFFDDLRDRLASAPPGPGVHATIRTAYERAMAEVRALPVAVTSAPAWSQPTASEMCAALVRATPAIVCQHERLRTEIYGPAVLAVPCQTPAELLHVVQALHGHLTATVHGDGDDFIEHTAVLDGLRRKVGRLIANGVPTGIEVSPAMVHGGPYPAASDARFTAVGTTSIQRWVRPACWQDWPAELLPVELRDDNPRGIRRWVDGKRV